jgi:hypothetical protein
MPEPCSGVPANPWCSGQVIHADRGALQRAVRQGDAKDRQAERFRSVSVKIGRAKGHRHKAHGRRATVRIDLARGPCRDVWVRFIERITVRSHAETIRPAPVYHRC